LRNSISGKIVLFIQQSVFQRKLGGPLESVACCCAFHRLDKRSSYLDGSLDSAITFRDTLARIFPFRASLLCPRKDSSFAFGPFADSYHFPDTSVRANVETEKASRCLVSQLRNYVSRHDG